MKKVVILTSDSLRHDYVRKAIALDSQIKVIKSFCEKQSHKIQEFIQDDIQAKHIFYRDLSERDFFENFVSLSPDLSNAQYIQKDEINDGKKVDEITELNPDIIVAYGCSLIKPPLIERFKDRILNVHLGLSPYYRGSGTNFFPFVNNELEYVGATFMYMDAGIDTGEIIHQIQAQIYPNDTMHQVGNRLIGQVAKMFIKIIHHWDNLQKIPQPQDKKSGKLYLSKDFTPESTRKAYQNLADGMVDIYLQNKPHIKLYENPILKEQK